MTKISKPRAARSTKSADAAAPEALVLHHAESVSFSDDGDAALNSLIAELNAPGDSDEVIDPVSDDVLDAAVNGAEAIDVMVASATPEGVEEGAAPTGDASDVVPETEVTASAKAPKVPKEKKVAVPRKAYSGEFGKTERLKDKLGAGLVDYSVLTLADAEVEEADLAAVMESTMVIIRSMNKKAQNWAVKFIEYMAGRKTSISEVTGTVIKLLEKDGAITTGNEGNLFKALVARPYSPGSARAMGGNNLAMLEALKVIVADGKGRFVANPESLLLMKVRSMMAAPVAAAPTEAVSGDLSAEDFETDAADAEALEADDELAALID
jgi:hypothetical protein